MGKCPKEGEVLLPWGRLGVGSAQAQPVAGHLLGGENVVSPSESVMTFFWKQSQCLRDAAGRDLHLGHCGSPFKVCNLPCVRLHQIRPQFLSLMKD